MTPEELSRCGYIWTGRGKPAELAPNERRDPTDPYFARNGAGMLVLVPGGPGIV